MKHMKLPRQLRSPCILGAGCRLTLHGQPKKWSTDVNGTENSLTPPSGEGGS